MDSTVFNLIGSHPHESSHEENSACGFLLGTLAVCAAQEKTMWESLKSLQFDIMALAGKESKHGGWELSRMELATHHYV